MAQYELSSARQDDLENTERDIFAPKKQIPEDAELVAACESEIRRFNQRDVPLIHQTDDEAGQTSGPAADRLRALIGSASNDAIDCIDRLILDLQDVCTNLRHKGERLEREVNSYVHLCDTAKLAARAIAERLVKSKTEPDEFDRPAAEKKMIFFTQSGDTIHGTYEQRILGRAVSHGCVRLSRKNTSNSLKSSHFYSTARYFR